jgi:L-amino acid N-acyltransferase YncA
MDYLIRLAEDKDAPAVTEVFNYFVKNSFAAYPSKPNDESFFTRMRSLAGKFPFYVVETPEHKVIGFALLRAGFNPADTMSRTAEATLFFLPEYTRASLGGRLLAMLEADAKARGVDNLLASVSSRNEQSLNFCRKHGFVDCGRFQRVGRKFDQDFDIIWLQKFI